MSLKELRRSCKITQADLASELGISVGSIRAYEQGWRRPSVKVATRIGNMFGMSTDEIWRMFYGTREKEGR